MLSTLFGKVLHYGSILALVALCGCRISFKRPEPVSPAPAEVVHDPSLATDATFDAPVESFDAESDGVTAASFAPPLTSRSEIPESYVELSLDRAIEIGLTNSKILRSLGGRLLEAPASVPAAFDPAIQYSDPVFGVEAALADFDAQFSSSLNYANNDDVFNNTSATAREVQQDLLTSDVQLSKTAATGTQFRLRGFTQHDNNNLPPGFNLFNHSWTTFMEAQIRQPLLQGRGVAFNRIAGPNAQPGFRTGNGVVISRLTEDISVAEFERGVRNYVNEVIAAYWQVYFAYRSYDAAKSARDNSSKAWSMIKSRYDNDLPGGEADKEAQAREQYFNFSQQVVSALNGDSRNGRIGVFQAEANLRRLLGLPQSDGSLIRPADEPIRARVAFDWDSLVDIAMSRRVELRQQQLRMKQRRLELFAARNFLLPRLDATATYRNNGFGDDLLGGGSVRFASAGKDAFSGDHDEFEFGLQLNVPIGFRQASAGVKNAQLNLSRERALFREQQQQVAHDLGSAVRQADQASESLTFALNRLVAARQTLKAREVAFDADVVQADLLLEAQRRLIEAEIAYFQAELDHTLANEAVHLQSGQMLSAHGVQLGCSESGVVSGQMIANQTVEDDQSPR